MAHVRLIAFAAVLVALAGCAGLSAAQRLEQTAGTLGLERQLVHGTQFWHVTYRSTQQDQTHPLHVYLDGDGSPWRDLNTVAIDPTPNDPIALRLLALDTAPSVYLGRPCYHGYATEAPCTPDLWTHARYSPQVRDSLVAALRQFLRQYPHRSLVLIGFSGGGTLALLLAPQLPQTLAVVTVAGNLDTDAWTDYHGYSRLSRSLNPATEPGLDEHILQRHYVGSHDERIPPRLSQGYARRYPTAQVLEINDAGHAIGWERHWPSILRELPTALQ
jgi:pimeloyl-ACP methyl ester carboxylesterase